jgi:hypothetical protein
VVASFRPGGANLCRLETIHRAFDGFRLFRLFSNVSVNEEHVP